MGVIVDMSKNSLRGHAKTYANWSNLKLSLALFGGASSSFCFSRKLQKLQAPPNGVASSSGEKLGKLVFALKSEKHLSRCFPSFSPPLLFQLARSSARPRRPIPSPRRPSPLPNPQRYEPAAGSYALGTVPPAAWARL